MTPRGGGRSWNCVCARAPETDSPACGPIRGLMGQQNQPVVVSTGRELGPVRRYSRARFAAAFAVAAVSDFLSLWTEFALPVQWVLDMTTAGLLFLILGRRWELLPGLVAEAIPGLAVFPVWVLVVISIIAQDEIKAHRRARSG